MVISATEFKAKCLQLLDQVNETGEIIQVTKRGKIVAELTRPQPNTLRPPAGFARETLKTYGDIMEPLDVEWDAMK